MEPRPDWWDYELVLSPHAIERMAERGITEVELRAMLDDVVNWRDSMVPVRYIVVTEYEREPWEIVVEPDDSDRELIVVTVYRVE